MIAAGADVNRAGQFGRPPLWYAIGFQNRNQNIRSLIGLLIERGANINFRSKTRFFKVYRTSELLGLVNKQVEIGGCDVSALHQAVGARSAEAVELLLQRGVDSTITDPKGRTALGCAREALADPLMGKDLLPELAVIVELLSKAR